MATDLIEVPFDPTIVTADNVAIALNVQIRPCKRLEAGSYGRRCHGDDDDGGDGGGSGGLKVGLLERG